MSELGQYAVRFTDWRKALATVPHEKRYIVFKEAVADVAQLIPAGLNRGDAADELFQIALAQGFNLDDAQIDITETFREVPDPPPQKDEEPQHTNGHDKHEAKAPLVEPTLYLLPDPASLPKRAWMHATHYIRRTVTATVAPGGFGKTTLALFDALLMAVKGYRVWYISGEDDKLEIDRRIAAHRKKHNFDFGDRLFVDDKLTFPFKIAKSGRNGPELDRPRVQAFEQAIKRRAIDVIILDPFVSFHLLSENDTAAMDALVKMLGDICVRCECCIELAHHVRKPGAGQYEITVHDARGAAAIVNAVRSCRVLNQMSVLEAQQAQTPPDQRYSYIRVDSGKRNMAPPEKATWWRLISEEIANGDNVQTLEAFEFKVQSSTVEDDAWVRHILKDRAYRADSRSPDWFGLEIASRFKRDPDNKGDIKWINAVISTWVNRKLIRKVTRDDENRRPRMFIELVEQQHAD